jgi:hypothetical protein
MQFHTATLTPYYDDTDQWVSVDQFNGTGAWIEYRAYSRYTRRWERFSLLYVGPEGECRRVHQGPVLPGPYAAMIPQATMIAAHPQARPAQTVELEEGDVIVFNDQPMVLIDDRPGQYPQLVTPEEFDRRMPLALARRGA